MKTASVILLAFNQSQNWLYMHDQSKYWTLININLHVANTEKDHSQYKVTSSQ